MKIIVPEVVSAGMYNARIAYKGKSKSLNRRTSMFELELPIVSGGISYIDTDNIRVSDDIFIIAKPGQVRHTVFPFECFFIHMTLEPGELYDVLMKLPNFIRLDSNEEIRTIMEEVSTLFKNGATSDSLMLQSLVIRLICLLERISGGGEMYRSLNGDGMIERAIKYISDNLALDLRLETVAAAVSISPIHFHNRFKRDVGMTFHKYVEAKRFNKALSLLVTTDKTLSEIAYECGFSSQSYFNYVFKRRMNTTPREYTKEFYNKYHM